MARVALAALASLMGCDTETAPRCLPEGGHLVIATTDFEVGALATIDGAACVGDRWSSTGPDPLVREIDGALLVLDRAGGDRVREFAARRYETPVQEFSLGVAVNAHDVVAVGEERWFALYERAAVARTSPSGEPLGEIDLSAHADSDGLPEIDRLILREGIVYASLQRLDRSDGWAPRDGLVIGLSTQHEIVSSAVVGHNPKLYPDPSDEGALLALTGRWYTLDGGLSRYDPRTGAVDVLLSEEEIGYDLGSLAGIGEQLVLLGVDSESRSRMLCFDLQTSEWIEGPHSDAWYVDALAAGGSVYVAVRTGWDDTIARALWQVDPALCSVSVVTESLSLDPYTMAWVP